MKEDYILNGKHFGTYEDAVQYCATMNWRIVNTQTIAIGIFLLTVVSIN